MKKATVKLFHDTRDDSNRIKLSVVFKRKPRLYTTGIKVDAKTFDRIKKNEFNADLDGKIKDENTINVWRQLFSRDKERPGFAVYAQTIIDELGHNFTFESFKQRLDNYGKAKEVATPDDTNPLDLIKTLLDKAEASTLKGQITTGSHRTLVAKSLTKFVESLTDEERAEFGLSVAPKRAKQTALTSAPLLEFKHVTADFLEAYEQWMTTDQKRSTTTVGIYCRTLRTVFNDAIADKVIDSDSYPFGRRKYAIPSGEGRQIALSKDELSKLMEYQPIGAMEQRALDFWLFSYLCNGMNFADILSLQNKDLDLTTNTITFIRQKTAKSNKNNKKAIRVHLRSSSLATIQRWQNPDRRPDAYLFPFLSESMDATKKKLVVNQFIKVTNKYIRLIASTLGINPNVTTYSARHSFATRLLHSDAPIGFISESMGHADIKTTQAYLNRFDDEKAKKILNALTDF